MEMQDLYNMAHSAGLMAGNSAKPIPMGVMACDGMGNPIAVIDVVSEGVCGFAWVTLKATSPMNRKFIAWAKKYNLIQKSCMGGFTLWVGLYNQSMSRKEAYARAFAKVLTENGVTCYAQSRMD